MTQVTKIRYADAVVGSFRLVRKPVRRSGGLLNLLPGQSADGYGKKITTDDVLQFAGGGRTYRVYASCFGNCPSFWIRHVKEGILHLR